MRDLPRFTRRRRPTVSTSPLPPSPELKPVADSIPPRTTTATDTRSSAITKSPVEWSSMHTAPANAGSSSTKSPARSKESTKPESLSVPSSALSRDATAVGTAAMRAATATMLSQSRGGLSSRIVEESAEWLSQIIGEMWPYASTIAESIFKGYIEPALVANMPSMFPKLRFTKIALGSRAPRFEAVSAMPGGANRKDLIALEADLSFDGNPLIELAVDAAGSTFKFGVKNMRFRGRVELLVRPLLPRLPLVGATQFAFVNPPFIDYELTGAAAWANFELFRSTFRNVTNQVVAALCVLPNRVSFKLDPRVDFLLYVAHPIGVLRVAVMHGNSFPNTDETMVHSAQKQAPDVYIRLQHGGVVKTTYRVDDNCDPVYRNQVFDFVLTSASKHQHLIIRAFDYDLGKQDDELGFAHVKVWDLVRNEHVEIPLQNCPFDASPTVSLMARKLDLSPDMARVQTAILTQRAETNRPSQCSRLLLTINISEANNLPPCTRPYVRATVGSEIKFETWTAYETAESDFAIAANSVENPKFEVSFHALLGEPISGDSRVNFAVIDQASGRTLGTAFALLSDLVTRVDHKETYVFALLDCSRPDSLLRASIKLDAVIDSPPLWTVVEDTLNDESESAE